MADETGGQGGPSGGAAADRGRPPRPRALRRYGQNHLVDGNILGAILEQAAVGPDDVVLEIGAAGGLLTRPLLERARLVHAFEIDGRWLPRLRELEGAEPRLRLHAGDALKADLGSLDPAPTALVANLAYNIAIPLIMTTVAEVPTVARWAVMLQRELADRLFARPGTKAYAAVSVLAQLACRREAARAVPPTAFRPQPRVESAFVTFVRRRAADAPGSEKGPPVPGPASYAAMDRLVRLAFRQRRKMLSTSLAGVRCGGSALTRDGVREALGAAGASPTARPEELSPPQWVVFARALGWLTGDPDTQGVA